MTVDSDRSYYKEHPQYHAFQHPEIPGYWEQIKARDHVLEKHPHLRFVGCHLGSLEYDVDELAKRLDKYPNFAVDMAARIVHFQVQEREKVRKFIIKYQDRLLYGTDNETGRDQSDPEAPLTYLDGVYRSDCRYFATGEEIEVLRDQTAFQGPRPGVAGCRAEEDLLRERREVVSGNLGRALLCLPETVY